MHTLRLLLLPLALLLAPSASTAHEPAHAAAAHRYIDAMTIRRLLAPLVVDYVSVVPAQGRAAVATAVFQSLDNEAVRHQLVVALVQTYSAAELDGMARFYGSDIGQSVLDKQIDLTSTLNLALRAELLASIQRAQRALGR